MSLQDINDNIENFNWSSFNFIHLILCNDETFDA